MMDVAVIFIILGLITVLFTCAKAMNSILVAQGILNHHLAGYDRNILDRLGNARALVAYATILTMVFLAVAMTVCWTA